MQLNKTPQITFGIKHSPLLGQLKPIEPQRPVETETMRKIASNTTQDVSRNRDVLQTDVNQIQKKSKYTVIQNNDNVENRDAQIQKNLNTDSTLIQRTQNESKYAVQNGDVIENHELQVQKNLKVSTDSALTQTAHAHTTQIRDTEIRSSTPDQVQETLTQELVWIPEKPIRRGSYTIDKGDSFTEKFQNSEVIPVENGVIRTTAQGVRGATCSEENTSDIVQRKGFEQSTQTKLKNASAHEKTQAATEEVRTGTEVQHLPNGGISKTTTTTTVRKMGTSAKTANATTTVSRTATVVTSRDVGTK